MPRPLRVEYAGACYHVINRGNYRRNLFDGKGAAEAFVRTLGEASERFGWRVHAFVVMSNHFHLAIELTEPNLSAGMKWLQGTWIRRYNGLRRLIGRPFQGRYKALHVEPGHALAQVCHYIHLNPVRAKLLPADAAADYLWSSLRLFASKARPRWLEAATLLAEAGQLADTPTGWEKYAAYLAFLAEDEPSKKALASEQLSRGWVVGTTPFRRKMRAHALEQGAAVDRFAGLDPESAEAERREVWEETLQRFAHRAKIDLAKLPAMKSAPEKSLLAAASKQRTSVSNAWLAERMGMGEPASASQFARRFGLTPEGRKKIATLLAAVDRRRAGQRGQRHTT
jgi:putative transposase